jgi:hypothetical protein
MSEFVVLIRRLWRRGAPWPALLCAVLLVGPGLAVAHAEPRVRAWTPSNMDSLSAWAQRARSMFRTNTGDSLGGDNYRAYQLVGKIGQNLLASLGRGNMTQAWAVEPVIDSLGLDTEISADVTLPYFALLMVRNPLRSTADVSGFIYWYVGNVLHYQGVRFTSGRNVVMRVWHTRNPDKPFSCGIIENARYGSKPLEFSLLRMSENGLFWTADQYPGYGLDLGGRGDAVFADLNNDGVPELVTWSRATGDSLFTECRECPGLLTERTWAERVEGFEIEESRLVPSAYANFVLFIRLLREGNRAGAARLLANPAKVSEAIANGWDKGSGRFLWRVLNVENDETWPHWIVVRNGRGESAKSWVIHFVVKDGRWIIQDWVQEQRQVTTH